MTQAVTYQAGERRGQLRTVLVENATETKVLIAGGSLAITTGQLLHGQVCRHEFWDEVLGTSDDTFAVPTEMVRAIREIGPMKIKRSCK